MGCWHDSLWQGGMSKKAIVDFIPKNAPAYTGPGDIATFAVWWGLRAYTAATIGNNLITIKRDSDSTSQDFTSISTGALDTASIATFLTSTTGKITKFYGQGGSGINLVPQSVGADYGSSVFGSLPGAVFSTAQTYEGSATINITTPFSLNFVANRYSGTAAHSMNGALHSNVQFGFNGSANALYFYCGGGLPTATASDASPHSVILVKPATTYNLYVDGSSAASGSDAGGGFNDNPAMGSWNQVANVNFAESGIINSDATSIVSSLTTNQKTYWGF
jgi:hypothetical protein